MKKPDFEKGQIKLWNTDCVEFIQSVPSESIDVICIDPPYLYLKNQKLERPFDERLFFAECKRVLSKNGFIVMFGRGVSFYRWNCLLDELGMSFKEEIVWNKRYVSSPITAIGRTHETVAIFAKQDGSVNKVKIPLVESYKYDPARIEASIKRLTSSLGNKKAFRLLKDYFENGLIVNDEGGERKFDAVLPIQLKSSNRAVGEAISISEGVRERSVIEEGRENYSTIHPTQKPVRLLERLIALVIPDKPRNEITVADFFGGSMSCMEAVHNMGMNGIACEIDGEYFHSGKERIESLLNKGKQSELF